MKSICLRLTVLICSLLWCGVSLPAVQAAVSPATTFVTHDLALRHNAADVLANPHRGRCHQDSVEHPNIRPIARDSGLPEFAGMDQLHLRLAWTHLEPREGQFHWAEIGRIIGEWTAHGPGIAFRISCQETNPDPHRDWIALVRR